MRASQEVRYKYKLFISSSDLIKNLQLVNGEVSSADTNGEEKSKKDAAQPQEL